MTNEEKVLEQMQRLKEKYDEWYEHYCYADFDEMEEMTEEFTWHFNNDYAYRVLVKMFGMWRGDILTSDRECAAFEMAVWDICENGEVNI